MILVRQLLIGFVYYYPYLIHLYILSNVFIFAKNVAGPPITHFYEGKSLTRFLAQFSMV
jgi:uncharacterized membrane protein